MHVDIVKTPHSLEIEFTFYLKKGSGVGGHTQRGGGGDSDLKQISMISPQ